MRLALPATALACLLLASSARAELRLYVDLEGGPSFAQNSHVSDRNGPETATLHYDLGGDGSPGWQAAGAVGLHWNRSRKNSFRFELAGGYHRSHVDRLTGDNTTLARGGDLSLATGLFNAYYEYDFGNLAWFRAFIGGGLGVGRVDFGSGDARSTVALDGDSFALAWNATAGVVLPLGDRFALTGAYRFLGTSEATIDSIRRDPNTGAVTARGNVDVDVGLHDLVFGVRFTF